MLPFAGGDKLYLNGRQAELVCLDTCTANLLSIHKNPASWILSSWVIFLFHLKSSCYIPGISLCDYKMEVIVGGLFIWNLASVYQGTLPKPLHKADIDCCIFVYSPCLYPFPYPLPLPLSFPLPTFLFTSLFRIFISTTAGTLCLAHLLGVNSASLTCYNLSSRSWYK